LIFGGVKYSSSNRIEKANMVDEQNRKIATQLDIALFVEIENALENYSLVQLMKEDKSEAILPEEAKKYYANLVKA
jgi:hypothetical protein